MALTATASPDTQKAIEESLHLESPIVISQPLDRRNIFLSVSPIKSLAVRSHTCKLNSYYKLINFLERFIWSLPIIEAGLSRVDPQNIDFCSNKEHSLQSIQLS